MSSRPFKQFEDGVTAPSFDKVMRILQAYHAYLQDFLRATGYLPKNRSPVALGKMRKIPVISWVAAGRWTETGESFLEEDVIEWIVPARDESRFPHASGEPQGVRALS